MIGLISLQSFYNFLFFKKTKTVCIKDHFGLQYQKEGAGNLLNHIVSFVSESLPSRRTEFLNIYLETLFTYEHTWPVFKGDSLRERALSLLILCFWDCFGLETESFSISWGDFRKRSDRLDRANAESSVRAGSLLGGGGLVFLDASHWAYHRHLGSHWASQPSLPPPTSVPL